MAEAYVDEGFIVLWRAMMDSWFWKLSPTDFKIGVACLFLANWQDRKWYDGQKMVTIPRGTFVDSTGKLAEKCGPKITRKMVRGALRRLEVAEFLILGTRKGQAYTTITIVNYEEYQKVRKKEGQDEGQARAKQGPGTGHNITIKPSNKGSMSEVGTSDGGEGKKESKSRIETPERAFKAADYLRRRIVHQDPDHKLSHTFPDHQREKWAKTFDLIHRRDQRSWEEIGQVVKWLYDSTNTFVVFSPTSLREKFDNIRAAMKADKTPQYVNGQRKLPPPTAPAPEPERHSGETQEQWRERRRKEREERERQANEQG